MEKTKRKLIYMNPALERVRVSTKQGGFSRRLGEIVERYEVIMQDTQTKELTDTEIAILGEVIMGSMVPGGVAVDPKYLLMAYHDVKDGIEDAATGTEAERKALKKKVKDWAATDIARFMEDHGI